MRIQKYLILALVLASGCNISHKQEVTKLEELPTHQKPYYIKAPIAKWSSIQSPCIDVAIENKTFSMELDLGFRGNLTFTKPYVDTISSKTFLKEKLMYGIRGKEYVTKLYQIPTLQIGKMTFLKPVLQEEKEDFIRDATFVPDGQKRSPRDPGRLGWQLFCKVNLLVDSKNSLIAFCDSIETLGKQGYEVKQFIDVPLFLERGLIEFDAKTPEGNLRCALDTGATWNMLNCEGKEEKTIDDMIWDPSNVIEYSSISINGKDFGPISFHKLPIKIPIRIEAILGADFFKNHIVFLDFNKKRIYFSKNQEK